ncbi:MAG: hypothetical protein ACOVQU_14260, partial [Exiguobacterium acetylicum]
MGASGVDHERQIGAVKHASHLEGGTAVFVGGRFEYVRRNHNTVAGNANVFRGRIGNKGADLARTFAKPKRCIRVGAWLADKRDLGTTIADDVTVFGSYGHLGDNVG